MFSRSVSDRRWIRTTLILTVASAIAFMPGHWHHPSTSLATPFRLHSATRPARAKRPSVPKAATVASQSEGQIFTTTIKAELSSGPLYEQSPKLTAEQEAAIALGAAQSDLPVPVREGEAAGTIVPTLESATEPVTGRAGDASLSAPGAAAGSNNFKYLTVSDLPTSAAPNRSTMTSPSVAAAYGMAFMTGNWFAALSTDFGNTWRYVSPFSTFPSVNGSFCCQQDTLYDPFSKSFIWLLRYNPDSTSNSVLIARADMKGVAANTWTSYRISPENFGYGAGHILDDPKLAKTEAFLLSGNSDFQEDLVVTANVFKISDRSFVGAVIWRMPMAQMAAGGNITIRYHKTDIGGLRCTVDQSALGEVNCASFSTRSKLKIFTWEANSISSSEVTVPAFAWMDGDGVANTPDGKNWAAGETSHVQAIWAEPSPSIENHPLNLTVAWGAKQDASHPYPYIIFASLMVSNDSWSVGKRSALWSDRTAWLYPAGAENGFRAAGMVAYGGGEFYPGTNVWTVEGGSPASSAIELHAAAVSNAGPTDNQWGRSFAVREVYGDFVAATYYLKDGGTSAHVVPRFLWFDREGSLAPAVAAVNAASYRPSIARDSIAALFGNNLAHRTAVATGVPAPTLADRSVLVGFDDLWVDLSRPRRLTTSLFFVSPGQINLYVQGVTPAGASIIQVTDNQANLCGFGIAEIVNVAPGIFSANADGRGVPAANAFRVRANGSQSYESVARWDGAKFVSAPIDLGPEGDQVFLILYGTGFRHRSSLAAVNVKVGGIDAPVLYAGEQGGFVGLDQLNVRLPRGLASRGTLDVIVTVDGVIANTVEINLR